MLIEFKKNGFIDYQKIFKDFIRLFHVDYRQLLYRDALLDTQIVSLYLQLFSHKISIKILKKIGNAVAVIE